MANIDNGVMLGALGSVFTDTTAAIVPPTGMVIVAIQMITKNNIVRLTAQEPTRFYSTLEVAHGAADPSTDVGTGGQSIGAGSCTFPAGMTIYGRWINATFAADADGGVICYFGY